MSTTVKNSKMARRYGEEFKRQAVELVIHSGKTPGQDWKTGYRAPTWEWLHTVTPLAPVIIPALGVATDSRPYYH